MSPCCQERTTPEMARCSCGHRVVAHVLSPKKERKACTHMDGTNGQCLCKGPR